MPNISFGKSVLFPRVFKIPLRILVKMGAVIMEGLRREKRGK